MTTVVLVSLVPAVVHTVTLEKLRQALGDIPTGEIAKGTLDILPTPLRKFHDRECWHCLFNLLLRTPPQSCALIFSKNHDVEEDRTKCHFLLSE